MPDFSNTCLVNFLIYTLFLFLKGKMMPGTLVWNPLQNDWGEVQIWLPASPRQRQWTCRVSRPTYSNMAVICVRLNPGTDRVALFE